MLAESPSRSHDTHSPRAEAVAPGSVAVHTLASCTGMPRLLPTARPTSPAPRSAQPEEVIIIIASLMKDMNSPVDLYRANSIRVLSSIIDPGMLQQVERYFKQAVVDRNPAVASSALASAYKLAERGSLETVRRWLPEIQEGMKSAHASVQFLSIALQHALWAQDRQAVSKLVASLQKAGTRAPMPSVLQVRYVAEVLKDSQASGVAARCFNQSRRYHWVI